MPNIGYGSNKKTKHLLPQGMYKFTISNLAVSFVATQVFSRTEAAPPVMHVALLVTASYARCCGGSLQHVDRLVPLAFFLAFGANRASLTPQLLIRSLRCS